MIAFGVRGVRIIGVGRGLVIVFDRRAVGEYEMEVAVLREDRDGMRVADPVATERQCTRQDGRAGSELRSTACEREEDGQLPHPEGLHGCGGSAASITRAACQTRSNPQVWVWVLSRRRTIGTATLFGKYVHLYLLIAGASLLIDGVDVVRYLVGDGELLHRWS